MNFAESMKFHWKSLNKYFSRIAKTIRFFIRISQSFLCESWMKSVILLLKGVKKMRKFLMFVFAMVISFIPGIIGGFFSPMSPGANVWYNGLNQSVLTPNGMVFLWAWLILYAILGVALFLVMNSSKARQNKSVPYALFATQMGLNALWSYLFFGLHFVGAALLCLVALIAIAIWMAFAFKKISRAASYLVWPYVAWLLFALYLNGMVLFLN